MKTWLPQRYVEETHESAKDHENCISKMDFPVPLKLCQHRVQTLKTESKFAIGNNFQFHKKCFIFLIECNNFN